jgi:hypothetical protein
LPLLAQFGDMSAEFTQFGGESSGRFDVAIALGAQRCAVDLCFVSLAQTCSQFDAYIHQPVGCGGQARPQRGAIATTDWLPAQVGHVDRLAVVGELLQLTNALADR